MPRDQRAIASQPLTLTERDPRTARIFLDMAGGVD